MKKMKCKQWIGQRFHQCQENEQFPLTSNYMCWNKKKELRHYDVGNPGLSTFIVLIWRNKSATFVTLSYN